MGEWCPAACLPGEEGASGAVDWAGCENVSGGRGGGGEGGCAPFMTGGRAVRAPGRLRGPQEGTDGQGGRGGHMRKGPQ